MTPLRQRSAIGSAISVVAVGLGRTACIPPVGVATPAAPRQAASTPTKQQDIKRHFTKAILTEAVKG